MQRKDYLVQKREPAAEVEPPAEAWPEPPADPNLDVEEDVAKRFAEELDDIFSR